MEALPAIIVFFSVGVHLTYILLYHSYILLYHSFVLPNLSALCRASSQWPVPQQSRYRRTVNTKQAGGLSCGSPAY